MITTAQVQKTDLVDHLPYPESLSVIIPAYNEENRIKPLLLELTDFIQKNNVSWEIIVSIDGNDGTQDILESFARNYPFVRYIKNGNRDGKGNAIRNALDKSRGEYVLLMDADRSIQFEDIQKQLKSLENCDALIFDRYSNVSNEIPFLRRIASRGFNFLVRAITGVCVKDTQTGYKVIRTDIARKAFKKVTVTNTFYDVSLLYNIKKMGGRITEVGVRYHHDHGSKFNLIPEIFGQGISLLGFRLMHSRFGKYIPEKIKTIYYRKFRWI